MSAAQWREGMVAVGLAEAVAVITLDRPDKLNSMVAAFWGQLRNGLDWASSQPGVRCVIVRGAGDRAFSAGGDVASFMALASEDERRAFQVEAMAAFQAVATSRLPTIAAVHGYAFGGGCELAMSCDMVIADETAEFALPEARFGLVPGYGVLRAPLLIGAQMTKMMILAGERVSAVEALRHGLVQKVVARGFLMDEAMRLATAITRVPPAAVAAAKSLIGSAVAPVLVHSSIELVTELHGSPETRQAVSQFMDPSR